MIAKFAEELAFEQMDRRDSRYQLKLQKHENEKKKKKYLQMLFILTSASFSII